MISSVKEEKGSRFRKEAAFLMGVEGTTADGRFLSEIAGNDLLPSDSLTTFGVLHRLNPPQAATMQERSSKRKARDGLKFHFRLNLPLAAVENTFLRGEKAENEENGRFFD